MAELSTIYVAVYNGLVSEIKILKDVGIYNNY